MSASQGSFFDRYPWTGAALFFALILVVGFFLSTTIGERPHYRSEFKLVTETPDVGKVPEGSGLEKDPIRIQVLLRVEQKVGEPALGIPARLLEPRSRTILSEGKTAGPGGHLLLPVPSRFDQDLFEGRLVVAVERASGEVLEAAVPKPERGKATVYVDLSAHPSGLASGTVTGPDGKTVEGALVIVEIVDRPENAAASPAISSRSDRFGRFHFGPSALQGRFRLTAYADELAARSDVLAPPAHQVDLVLARTGGVQGTIPPGLAARAQRIGLADTDGRFPGLLRSTEAKEGPLRMDGIPAGPYRLMVQEASGLVPLREVTIRAGEVTDLGVLEAK